MVSAIHGLVPNRQVNKGSSLMIDDNPDNIRVARENGARAVWLDPEHLEHIFADLSALG